MPNALLAQMPDLALAQAAVEMMLNAVAVTVAVAHLVGQKQLRAK